MTITWLSSYIISSPIKRSFRLAGWFFKMLTTSPGFSTSLCCVETILLMDTCPLDNIDFTEFLPLLCKASNKKGSNSISPIISKINSLLSFFFIISYFFFYFPLFYFVIILLLYYFKFFHLFHLLSLITHILIYYNTFY